MAKTHDFYDQTLYKESFESTHAGNWSTGLLKLEDCQKFLKCKESIQSSKSKINEHLGN